MPGWLTDHFSFDFRALLRSNLSARQSARKSKQNNGRLASLASNSLVRVAILGKLS